MESASTIGAFCQESKNDQMLTFFIQLISMTKHMVDDILPDLLLLFDKPTLESLIHYSEEFYGSMHVFMKLCGVISRKNLTLSVHPVIKQLPSINPGKSDLSSVNNVDHSLNDDSDYSPHQLNSKSVDGDKQPSDNSAVTDFSSLTCEDTQNNDNVWKLLLSEVSSEFHTNKSLTKFYYCGLCNIRSNAESIWQSHVKGKKHVSRNDKVANVGMVCETCGFHIVSDDLHIALIMESREHLLLDDAISKEFGTSKTSKSNQQKPIEEIPQDKPSAIELKSGNQDIREAVSGKVMFKGKVICSNFAILTSQICKRIETRKKFTACYCRPCDVVSKSKEGWVQHISSPKHVTLMQNKAFNNVLCRCRQCDFGIMASEVIALCYMKFHIEECHKQPTDDIIHEEYLEIKEITKKIATKDRANKGSTDSMNLSRRSSVNDETSARSKSALDREPSVADCDMRYSEKSMSYQSLTAKSQSAEYGGSSQDSSRVSSRASLRGSPEPVNPPGGFLKYLQDVCAPLEAGKRFSANDNRDKMSPSSGRGTDSAQSSGKTTPLLQTNNAASYVPPLLRMDVSYGDGGTRSASHGVFKKPKSTAQGFPGGKQSGNNSNRPPLPQERPKFMVSGDNDSVASFIVMLRHKEINYEVDPSYKPFSALCLLCPNLTFSNSFEWCDHILSHTSSDSQNEVQCSYCNSHLYGNVAEINQLLLPHDEHIRIDRLMKS